MGPASRLCCRSRVRSRVRQARAPVGTGPLKWLWPKTRCSSEVESELSDSGSAPVKWLWERASFSRTLRAARVRPSKLPSSLLCERFRLVKVYRTAFRLWGSGPVRRFRSNARVRRDTRWSLASTQRSRRGVIGPVNLLFPRLRSLSLSFSMALSSPTGPWNWLPCSVSLDRVRCHARSSAAVGSRPRPPPLGSLGSLATGAAAPGAAPGVVACAWAGA
mmetsp:Transcript_45828/g.103513  ORF Transcript_45828/g.103513 Transcript_45828/m.103513 type:complete len:219 (+) Transcript_45828:442-1098(+)